MTPTQKISANIPSNSNEGKCQYPKANWTLWETFEQKLGNFSQNCREKVKKFHYFPRILDLMRQIYNSDQPCLSLIMVFFHTDMI